MLVTIISFILILGFMIFVHEMGHFVMARVMGVKAEEFGFGFPPRVFGVVFNEHTKKWDFIRGNKKIGKRKDTIYSLNWIPLGGFVKILGEDGDPIKDKHGKKDPQSFSSQAIWKRIVILAAGVVMNFLGAILILSFGFFIGLPQAVEDDASGRLKDPKIQVVEIAKESPASSMGLAPGDQLVALAAGNEIVAAKSVDEAVVFLERHAGSEVVVEVKRGDDIIYVTGTPRLNPPEGQGALGIVLTKTAIVSYPFFESIERGVIYSFDIAVLIVKSLGILVKDLVTTGKTAADVSGPVGIFFFANQAAEMGLAYILQFAAVLSINLAIINILPLPALDGGRIAFLILEKIKKSPVSLGLEQKVHLVGFYLLILLMAVVTIKDLIKFRDSFASLARRIQDLF